MIEQLSAPDGADDAAEVLAAIGPPAKAAVPALIAQLDSPDQEFRVTVCRALGRIGTAAQPATTALRALLKTEDIDIRKAAEEALRQISGPDRN